MRIEKNEWRVDFGYCWKWAYIVKSNQILRLKWLKGLKYWGGINIIKILIFDKLILRNIVFIFIYKIYKN